MRSETERRLPRQAFHGSCTGCLAEFEEHMKRAGFADLTVRISRGSARHFLVWLETDGTETEAVDDVVMRRFRDHDCRCRPLEGRGGRYKRLPERSHGVMSGVAHFVHFLEQTGRTAHPGEVDLRRRLLTDFLEQRAAQGHTSNMLYSYRAAVSHFLAWLHHSRIPIGAVTSDVVDRFFKHDCLCLGQFGNLSKASASSDYGYALKRFTKFLVERGVVPDVFEAPGRPLCSKLGAFHHWLRRHRGVGERTIREHDRAVCTLVADLGNDPRQYNATSVREVLLCQSRKTSRANARRLASSMRMYLRFLVSNGDCPPSLVDAVPGFAGWRLSTLPRYILTDDVERVIASCDLDTAIGVRDRAILLLLARLALRAADIVHLRLGDIDWSNARLHVCGKSKQSAGLPLPQEVGDALLEYIEKARPRVDEGRVFMCVRAPYRPFATSGSITSIVSQALARAGVHSANGQGAHLLRHSAATGLLRSGASLEIIGALLRHRSPQTTAIYAKVDASMLQQVAQPWIGDLR